MCMQMYSLSEWGNWSLETLAPCVLFVVIKLCALLRVCAVVCCVRCVWVGGRMCFGGGAWAGGAGGECYACIVECIMYVMLCGVSCTSCHVFSKCRRKHTDDKPQKKRTQTTQYHKKTPLQHGFRKTVKTNMKKKTQHTAKQKHTPQKKRKQTTPCRYESGMSFFLQCRDNL